MIGVIRWAQVCNPATLTLRRPAVPEELMAATTRPVSILWGEADPWENVHEGRRLFAPLPSVVEFVSLPGVGHCPQVRCAGALGCGLCGSAETEGLYWACMCVRGCSVHSALQLPSF